MPNALETFSEAIKATAQSSFPGITVTQHLDKQKDQLSTAIACVGRLITPEECRLFLTSLRASFDGLDFHDGGVNNNLLDTVSTFVVHAEEARAVGGLLKARNRRTAAVVTLVIYALLVLVLVPFVNFDRAPWTLAVVRASHLSHALKWAQNGLLASWRS